MPVVSSGFRCVSKWVGGGGGGGRGVYSFPEIRGSPVSKFLDIGNLFGPKKSGWEAQVPIP